MKKIVLRSHSYKNFSPKFSNVFNSKTILPQKVFSELFQHFYVYNMNYFYENIGWQWILDISLKNNEKMLYFTSQVEKYDNFQVAYIPNTLDPGAILEQIDILEHTAIDKKKYFFSNF